MFLLPDINLKLRPKILDLKPGTRIVSNTFTMGDWTRRRDRHASATAAAPGAPRYLWIVPAKVDGTWKLPQGELTLKQEFQMLSGTLRADGKTLPLREAKVRGDEIVFTAGGAQYTGKVNGKRIDGSTRSGAAWSATRAG